MSMSLLDYPLVTIFVAVLATWAVVTIMRKTAKRRQRQCGDCREVLTDDARFCPRCGRKVEL